MERVLGNLSKGLVFVLSAPAGTGKTTLVRMLKSEFTCVADSISCTTRSPRPGEVDGRDYHFLSAEAFDSKVRSGDFLEHAEVFGQRYGTSSTFVLAQQNSGRHVFLVIDTQGAMQLREKQFQAVYIFLSPPSLHELRERLIRRKTESAELIEQRLAWARREMQMAPRYDYQIINAELSLAYDVLRSIVIAEEHKIHKESHQYADSRSVNKREI